MQPNHVIFDVDEHIVLMHEVVIRFMPIALLLA